MRAGTPDLPSSPGTGWRCVLADPRVIAAVLAAVTLFVYWPVRGFDFVNVDDPAYAYENPRVMAGLTWDGVVWAFTNWRTGFWIPLTWLSLMLDVTLFGKGAAGMHATNLLLHTLNTLLLFGLLRRMTGATWRSAWVAAIFALHPLHVESVAWITERKDVLSTCFGFAAVWFYARYVADTGNRGFLRSSAYWLAVLFHALSLMSKPMLVTLPLLLLLLDWWPLRRPAFNERPFRLARLLTEKVPFLLLATGFSVVSVLAHRDVGALDPMAALPLGARLANAAVSYARYVAGTFWPTDLGVFYPHPGQWPAGWVMSLAAIGAGITVAVIRLAGERRYLVTGWAWFTVALVPVIGLVQAGTQAMADRFMYVPMTGLAIIAAWGLADAVRGRQAWGYGLGLAGLGTVLLCGAGAAMQLRYWRDSETLLRHTLAVTRDNAFVHCYLGSALSVRGRTAEAIDHYSRAIAIAPRYAEALCNLGVMLDVRGEHDKAMDRYRQALAARPDYAEAHYNLGLALDTRGRRDEAVVHYLEAIALKPDYAEAHNNLGHVFRAQGRNDEAKVHYLSAIAARPDYAEAHNNLGNVLAAQGRAEEAIERYSRAIALKPGYAEAHCNLGLALDLRGRGDEAIAHYQNALALKPDYAEAHLNLGNALAARGRAGEAIMHYRAAVGARPDLAEAQANLGRLLAGQGRLDEAIEHFSRAVALRPDFVSEQNALGVLLAARGRPGEAVDRYRRALQTEPDNVAVQRNLAWVLAVAPQSAIRNGEEAVRRAERANELTQGRVPIILDALAAAYAERGRFPEAVTTAGKAVELARTAGDTNLAAQIQTRLELYRQGQPFREKGPAGP